MILFVEWTKESRESGDKEETDNQVHKTTGRSSSYTGRLHGAAHKNAKSYREYGNTLLFKFEMKYVTGH